MKPALAITPVYVVLLLLNAIGAASYVVAASHGWRIAEEHGEIPVTGEPFVWFAYVWAIIAGFLVLNLIWGALIVMSKQWRSGRLWLLILPIWLVAIVIDFAHH